MQFIPHFCQNCVSNFYCKALQSYFCSFCFCICNLCISLYHCKLDYENKDKDICKDQRKIYSINTYWLSVTTGLDKLLINYYLVNPRYQELRS